MAQKYGPKNVVLGFCDTLIEDEDCYRFVYEGAVKLGCELKVMRDGRDPWQVFADKRYMGNTRTAHCTTELKGKMFAKWVAKEFPPDECIIYFGFDWTESHRLDDARKNWSPYRCEAPLCEEPYLNEEQILDIVKSYNMEIPRLYGLDFVHNNCGGFCVRAGQAHYANLLEKRRHIYLYHEEKQEQLMRDIPTVRPFLRMTRNKVTNYLTLRQFRRMIESGGEYDPLDYGGCGCFSAADGETVAEIMCGTTDEEDPYYGLI